MVLTMTLCCHDIKYSIVLTRKCTYIAWNMAIFRSRYYIFHSLDFHNVSISSLTLLTPITSCSLQNFQGRPAAYISYCNCQGSWAHPMTILLGVSFVYIAYMLGYPRGKIFVSFILLVFFFYYCSQCISGLSNHKAI